MSENALQTLVLPFESGFLTWPETGPVLFLRARPLAGAEPSLKGSIIAVQSFRPDAEALLRNGFAAVPATPPGTAAPLVLVLLPRQRDEARALMAEAFSALAPGGVVVAAALNAEGARSLESDFIALAGPAQSHSKHKARVFWAGAESLDQAVLAQWRTLDTPRPIAGGRFISRPGLFAWDRIDPGSALLAEHLPDSLSGHAADLGAGFGYLSAELLARCPRLKAIDLYEAEGRALDLARQNLSGVAIPLNFFWHDVATGLPGQYDVIVTNPPFHEGRAERTDLGLAFIASAAKALKPGGRLLLVANRHLPYEAALTKAFASLTPLADKHGYKVLLAQKAGR